MNLKNQEGFQPGIVLKISPDMHNFFTGLNQIVYPESNRIINLS